MTRFQTTVAEIPARITGSVHGLWDSQNLDADFADLTRQLADRRLTHMNVFDTYYTVSAVSQTDAEGEDTYSFRGGRLEEMWGSPLTNDSFFAITDVNAGAIRKATSQVYVERPGAVIGSVSLNLYGPKLMLHVYLDDKYGGETLLFDAATGEVIPTN